jgi:hypothetical protein
MATKRIKKVVPAVETPVVHEVQRVPFDVEQVAYQMYEARGREPGFELDDWLRAESLARSQP